MAATENTLVPARTPSGSGDDAVRVNAVPVHTDYDDPYGPNVKWWSWQQTLTQAWKYGIKISMVRLRYYGRHGYFKVGKKAKAPTKIYPVLRASAEAWMLGKEYKGD